ncbi:MAG: Swt1 family HEPN domain-containing protein [Chloroflexi bacterium]|nr:Swt1 family HEPN domain-containing protein [Chloroflexota bacterium]
MTDANDALKSVENVLRDFIEEVLREQFGDSWVAKCGVTPERVDRWNERREEERRRLRGSGVEERLLYYADFYDIPTILKKNWQLFEPCFGDWKTMEVYLDKLEDFRNPDAHRRELFPYQAELISGISGEIRSKITFYRSQKTPSDEYFPRIEYVKDSLGNLATSSESYINTGRVLRPGDEVTFVVKAWDPRGDTCESQLQIWPSFHTIVEYTKDTTLRWQVGEQDIGASMEVKIFLRSPRSYHARGGFDDIVSFVYLVLPKS